MELLPETAALQALTDKRHFLLESVNKGGNTAHPSFQGADVFIFYDERWG